MRRIARDLRTGAMSLYRHVPDKDALISLMIDEVIGETQLPVLSGNWRDDLRQLILDGIAARLGAARPEPEVTPSLRRPGRAAT